MIGSPKISKPNELAPDQKLKKKEKRGGTGHAGGRYIEVVSKTTATAPVHFRMAQ